MAEGNQRVAVVLAADHAVVRRGLRRLLDSAPGLDVVAEAADADSALHAVGRHRPAVFVLDLDRPGDISSLETIRAVAHVSPRDQRRGLGDGRRCALRSSCAARRRVACVLDDTSSEELVEAVRRASQRPQPLPDDLTEREFEVLRLLALGYTNAEIAAHLHLSVRTVEAHRAHLQQKLSRPSRAELVQYALERGLLHGADDPARG
jgi:two-component system response regulator NreC